MPFLMELDNAVHKIVRAIETRKKSYAFPWQLAEHRSRRHGDAHLDVRLDFKKEFV